MYNHILIPTDGSDLSEKAAQCAVSLAKALNAQVTAVHILPTRVGLAYGELAWVDEGLDLRMREQASSYLDRIEGMAKESGVKFHRALKASHLTWRGIIEVAQDAGCDLIVMAAHGRRGLQALVLGSETNRVLIHARVPVLVYREKAR